VLVTLANPLPAAIVGNPFRTRPMKTKSKRLSRRRTLRYRWKKRTAPGGRYAGFKAVVHDKAGSRKKHKSPRGHRWAWTGRKGTVSLLKKGLLVATNPLRLAASVKDMIVEPVTALPRTLPALFKGEVIKNVGFAAAGGVTALVGGQIVQAQVLGLLNKFAPSIVPSAQLGKGMVQRVVGASFALLTGGLVAKLALKGQTRTAFATGVAAAALVEALFPGRMAQALQNVPVVGKMLAPQASPVQGLAGMFGSDSLAGIGAYVEAPSYQGIGAYVEAPSYQGIGAYVEAPSYQGVGSSMDDAVAGLNGDGLGYDPNQLAGAGHLGEMGAMGANMASHLDS